MLLKPETIIKRVSYHGHRLGGDSNGLCDLAELRHTKAMAIWLRDGKGITGIELFDQRRR